MVKTIFICIIVIIITPLFLNAQEPVTLPSEYLTSIQEKINSSLALQNKDKTEKGEIKVRIVLAKDGSLKISEIVQSSGNKDLDSAVIKAINSSAPFPPSPSQQEKIELIIPIILGEKTLENINSEPYHDTVTPPIPPLSKGGNNEGVIPLLKEADNDISSEKEYFSTIYAKINEYLFYPEDAKKEKLKGEGKVQFIITETGKAEKIEIVKSTGLPILDNAIISTIKNSEPLPSPSQLGKKTVELILPVSFDAGKIAQKIGNEKTIGKKKAEEKVEEAALQLLSKEDKKKIAKKKEEKEPISNIDAALTKKEDLKTLFDIAKNNSYPLKIAIDQLNLSKIKIKESVRNLFPALGVELSTTEGESITDPYKSRRYGMKMDHTLYDGGQKSKAVRRDKLNLDVAEQNYKKIENELFFEVLKNYYQYHKELQSLAVIEASRQKFDDYVKVGISLSEGNLITGTEFLKVQNIYNKARAELAAQQSRQKLSIAELKKVIGVEPQNDLPKLTPFTFKNTLTVGENFSEHIEKGLKLRPEIKLWEKSIEATELGYRIAKIENRPKLILESFLGKSGEAFASQKLELADTWNVVGKVVWLFGGTSFETSLGKEKTIPTSIAAVSTKTEADTASFKMNLLDKLKHYTEIEEGRVAVKQAEDEFIKIKKDIAWEVQEGFFSYTEAKERLGSSINEYETYKKELELKAELFKAGELELSEVMEVELRTIEAQLSLFKAQQDMYLGVATLDKATGFNLNLVEGL